MLKRILAVALLATAVGLGLTIGYVRVPPAAAVPAFARQYDLQCNACHTRPPRLNNKPSSIRGRTSRSSPATA